MRIALVSDWWAPRIGGIESQLFDLSGVLARRGHDVHVWTTTRGAVAPAGVTVEHIPTPMAGSIALPDVRVIGMLARRLESCGADVVHAHGMFSPLALAAILAARRLGTRSVLTIHSLLESAPVFVAARAIFAVAGRHAGVVTGVSRAVASQLQRASGRPVVVVPNGLDVDAWRAAGDAAGHDGDDVRIVGVLRLAPKKRPQDLVSAFAGACARAASENATLTIAGDGPMRRRLEEDVSRRQLASRVTFLGPCGREDVRRLVAGASMLAHPGGHEAFGLAVLEARAAGVPVVAMAAGGVPEIVEHGRDGLLASTTAEFGHHLALLAGDAALRSRLASAPRDNLTTFSWERVAGQYEAQYVR